MRLGIALPQRGKDVSAEDIARVAREAEAMGLDSVWVMDRLLRPLRPVRLLPDAPAEPLPEYYATVFDPIETLTYVAALTERVLLGTSAVNALFHPPVVLARRLATLDRLSGGRVIAGLVQGWLEEEFTAAGVPRSRRGEGLAEHVAAMRAVWGEDPVHFEGRFYRIPESQIGPKPLQPGGIPILIGCSSPSGGPGGERAGRIADGLHPYHWTREPLAAEIAAFRAAARAAGRDADALPIVARADGRLSGTPLAERDRPLFTGTLEQWEDDLAYVRELGVGHVFFDIEAPVEEQLRTMRTLRDRVA
ncbi:putative F420-dependent oxidoreductase [Thermocatellispora tengchongensis]|uniref:Putative F420-dependent oxidoreductase n=1 Tax=Thermocatellispora tengchongensis TaxID=1073253 RepID=A0A840PCS0_9ACTN|nr:TIGR03619 family F420-dependent LLM class oxidoreductase [Thermocatellispora tengchongensis]MBB5135641.1 putative F420-dependent oxidoreductase [Thermocatellispora tengchongensis]